MRERPTGTVTFLFTDIEGSTRLWAQYPASMPGALARHDALLRRLIESHGGYVFKEVGDALCAAFGSPGGAVAAALDGQRALAAEAWDVPAGFRVRMAVHAGAAEAREGDYYGPPLNRTARILAAGHGGQVLVSLAARELVRDRLPEGASLRDLGEHRLKDLVEPERLYQLVGPGLSAEFPPLRSLDGRKHNLPVQPTPLIGRDAEVRAVRERVRAPGSRLLTLTGPGGTGKTRLALQAAAELIEEFEHGVMAVFLAPIRDPEQVVPTIAHTLAVRDSGGRPPFDDLVDYLRARRMLVVLDNFEQVTEAAPVVPRLLAACPELRVLVTTREALRVSGEREFPVPPLGLPARGQATGATSLNAYPAVALFVERAQAVQPSFRVTDENATAVAEICRRLDGLPLAIELAAARVKLLPPRALAGRLERRLQLLTTGARDLPARQQTLRGAIDWSHDLLGEAERATFRRLAAFVSGCSLEAAVAVCEPATGGGPAVEALETIESLVNKSLVRQSEVGDGEPRFAMLETIHEYALERLEESGERDEVLRRHAIHFLSLAEQAEPALHGREQAAWLAVLEREHDNLRAALRRSLESDDPETAARIAAAIWRFWWVHGHLTEGRDWLERSLARSARLDPMLRARVLNSIGGLAYQQGDFARSIPALEEGLALTREIGNEPHLSHALGNLGTVLSEVGRVEEARGLYEESLAVDRRLGDKRGLAYTLGHLAVLAMDLGDYARAGELFRESLDLHGELGDHHSVAITLNNLGDLERLRGRLDAAETFYRESLEKLKDVESKPIQAHVLSNLGDVARDRADLGRARQLYAGSLAVSRELGQRRQVAIALAGIAALEAAEGRMERAARLTGEVRRLCERNDYRLRPGEERILEETAEKARAALGDQAFAVACTGSAMLLEDAIAYALEEPPKARPGSPDGARP